MSVTKYFQHTEIPQNVARQIVAPEGHRDEGAIFEASRWLRENASSVKVKVGGFDAVWLVTKHAESMGVERQPEIFTQDGMDHGNHNPTFAGGLKNRSLILELS